MVKPMSHLSIMRPGRWCRAGVTAGLALVGLGLSACTSTSTAAGPVSTSVVTAPSCQAGQLEGSYPAEEAAGSTVTVTIALENSSGEACQMKGYARLALAGESGDLPLRLVRGGLSPASAYPDRTLEAAYLAPGQAAQFKVQYDGSSGTCDSPTAVVITPPGSTSSLRVTDRVSVSVALRPCGPTPPPVVHISPIRPSA
jgi:hypothetical protein